MVAAFQGTVTVKSMKTIIRSQKYNKRSVNKKWEVCEYGTNLLLEISSSSSLYTAITALGAPAYSVLCTKEW